jgi:hypothetical protein
VRGVLTPQSSSIRGRFVTSADPSFLIRGSASLVGDACSERRLLPEESSPIPAISIGDGYFGTIRLAVKQSGSWIESSPSSAAATCNCRVPFTCHCNLPR